MNKVTKISIRSGIGFAILLFIFNFIINPIQTNRVLPMILFILLAGLIMGGYIYWYGNYTKIGKKHFEKGENNDKYQGSK